MTDNTGIYIHTPFCREKCHYCSFYSVPSKEGDCRIKLYVERLFEEIEQWCSVRNIVKADTVYFGGGTPSLLGVREISRILDFIRKKFILSADCEITLEMNPDHLLEENIKNLVEAGVNRIVLGVQTLNSRMRNKIGRKGKLCTKKDLDLFFSFENIKKSVDIIGGLPSQTWAELSDDIETLSSYQPDHISFYLLTLEEGTPLFYNFKPHSEFDAIQYDLWHKSIGLLKSKGYEHYEMCSFALNGAYSRHNMKYWTFSSYAGFGPGAHSFFDNRRYYNENSLEQYFKKESIVKEDIRTASDAAVEFILTSFRLLMGFNPARFKDVTGHDLPGEIKKGIMQMVDEGLVEVKGSLYRISDKGLDVFDSVVYRITEPLL
ncbi:MAG: radical SAM family heme chaperone HemW [Spirochaetota bacterium]